MHQSHWPIYENPDHQSIPPSTSSLMAPRESACHYNAPERPQPGLYGLASQSTDSSSIDENSSVYSTSRLRPADFNVVPIYVQQASSYPMSEDEDDILLNGECKIMMLLSGTHSKLTPDYGSPLESKGLSHHQEPALRKKRLSFIQTNRPEDSSADSLLPAFVPGNPPAIIAEVPKTEFVPEELPTEIKHLLDCKMYSIPVALVVSRDYALLPFLLPEGCGICVLGFYKIVDVDVRLLAENLLIRCTDPSINRERRYYYMT
jgi:hypothetical protein